MLLHFSKYQGTGNDFVMLDGRKRNFDFLTRDQIVWLCDRRFGIGADGLIILKNHSTVAFEMQYFNADGNQSSMCGNGGRCIARFFHDLGDATDKFSFWAIDGLHKVQITEKSVQLKMANVTDIERVGEDFFLDTGSPHHVAFVDKMPDNDFVIKAKAIRHSEKYKAEGVNVNFVEVQEKGLKIRTFERGVEDETLSCGTGVTACVLASKVAGKMTDNLVDVQAQGGQLQVAFGQSTNGFEDIWLIGPAQKSFEGTVNITEF